VDAVVDAVASVTGVPRHEVERVMRRSSGAPPLAAEPGLKPGDIGSRGQVTGAGLGQPAADRPVGWGFKATHPAFTEIKIPSHNEIPGALLPPSFIHAWGREARKLPEQYQKVRDASAETVARGAIDPFKILNSPVGWMGLRGPTALQPLPSARNEMERVGMHLPSGSGIPSLEELAETLGHRTAGERLLARLITQAPGLVRGSPFALLGLMGALNEYFDTRDKDKQAQGGS
jgi:hypothetical protein